MSDNRFHIFMLTHKFSALISRIRLFPHPAVFAYIIIYSDRLA